MFKWKKFPSILPKDLIKDFDNFATPVKYSSENKSFGGLKREFFIFVTAKTGEWEDGKWSSVRN